MYLPLYATLYGGPAKRLGLDITLRFAGNDDAVFKQVASNRADFGIGDPSFALSDKKHGVSCVAILVKRAGIWGVTHNPAIPQLESMSDFVQLRIGSFPKPSTTYELIAGLKRKHKRLLKNMQIVEAPIGAQAMLLTNNKADVILELEPMVSLAEAQGLRAVFAIAPHYGDVAFTGLMASKRMQDAHPALVDKMQRAIQQGIHICNHDKVTSLRIAAKIFPNYPESVLENAYARLLHEQVWPETGAPDEKLLKAMKRLRIASEKTR